MVFCRCTPCVNVGWELHDKLIFKSGSRCTPCVNVGWEHPPNHPATAPPRCTPCVNVGWEYRCTDSLLTRKRMHPVRKCGLGVGLLSITILLYARCTPCINLCHQNSTHSPPEPPCPDMSMRVNAQNARTYIYARPMRRAIQTSPDAAVGGCLRSPCLLPYPSARTLSALR